MGALLKLILCFYLLTLIFSMVVSLIKFIVDTYRWHDKEEKFETVESSLDSETVENSIENTVEEKEVKENATYDGECNSSVVFGTWNKP